MAAFAAANRHFLLGEYYPIWDMDGLFAPYFMFVADLARQGKLLWWNPWAGGGQPDFIDPQYGAHSPVVLTLGWLFGPTVRGFIYYWFAFWLLFGLGIVVLARHWRVPAWGAYVVALGLVFSGFFVGNAEHTSILFTWAWLPVVLWRLDVALMDGRWAAAAQSGLLFGLSALGGYPGVVFTNGVFLAFWIGVRLLSRDEAEQSSPRTAPTLGSGVRSAALLFGVAVLIALPTHLNFFLEGRGFTSRVGALPRSLAVDFDPLHPRALLTFASPYLATLPPRHLWDYTDISGCSLYCGGLVFTFALFSLFARPHSRFRWLLLAGSAFAVAASLGHELPIRGWLYDWVPLTRYFRHASWFRAYTIFITGILALHGTRDFATGVPGVDCRRRLLAATAISALLASMAYLTVLDRSRPVDRFAGDAHFLLAWGGPALVVPWMLIAPWGGRRAFAAISFAALATTDGVLAVGLANTLAYVGEPYRSIWAEVERNHRSEVDLLLLSGAQRKLEPRPGYFNKNIMTRTPVLHSYNGLGNETLEAWTHEPVLVASATSRNRFWFAADPVVAPPASELFQVFAQRSRELEAPPLIVHPRATMFTPSPATPNQIERVRAAPAAMRAAVVLESYLPDSLVLHFDTPRNGWLLVTDRWAPGWTAHVNGTSARVEGANFLFRGVFVRAGSNRIEFEYQPFGRPWLPFTSLAVILAVVGVSWHDGRRRRAAVAPLSPAAAIPPESPVGKAADRGVGA
jgi:hypothetical protein